MKKVFLFLLLLLNLLPARAQLTMYNNPRYLESFIVNHNTRMAAEKILTRQTDSIRSNTNRMQSSLLQLVALRTMVYNSLTEVNELLKDGRVMTNMTTLVSDILQETTLIIQMAAEDPELMIFATRSVNSIKTQALELYDEVSGFTNKGGTEAMMNNGTRDELLRKMTQRLQLLRGSLFAMHSSLYWKKMAGVWNSLNPFSTWVNRDKQIIGRILLEARML
ncbi:MAG: hypothetical protein AB2L20_07525 [Mangrovibacterium sp.]